MIMKKTGFSLLEILVVAAILSIFSQIIFATMKSAHIGLGAANNQINSQQEARRAVDRIIDELRMSNPNWMVESTSYPITISNSGNRIDFYSPTFDANNEITQLTAVRYYIGGIKNSQLLRREESSVSVLASDIDIAAIKVNPIFAFDNVDNSIINIRVPIVKQEASFILTSQANLRNREVQLDSEVEVVGIIEQ